MFEVEELVSLLRKENCRDLVTLRVDPERSYVDYLVVVTCRSPRHMVGLAEYVNKVNEEWNKKPLSFVPFQGIFSFEFESRSTNAREA